MCSLNESLEAPVEVNVLADPHALVVASDWFEDALATELRGALAHPHEVA